MSETKILCNYNITDRTFTNIFRCVILLKSRACMTDLILLNISVILCRPDLLIEEPRVLGEKHLPAACNRQT
jgi:hypothetical protein